jgi:hypothetical protein
MHRFSYYSGLVVVFLVLSLPLDFLIYLAYKWPYIWMYGAVAIGAYLFLGAWFVVYVPSARKLDETCQKVLREGRAKQKQEQERKNRVS